ncbi:hypothetical protein [Lysobacter sp. CFH 32150]|uniref:hypothetical protein n=1 Tax=Lysobacter sp. CFH 32150 TaxID=2927128 RepID=UPI001FA6BA4D|nr:hypothetical protein [Lysobacter sp. CFH 32150]MCI4567837.1 hypothetical protein [Lysobacter sp. CFH 32150]
MFKRGRYAIGLLVLLLSQQALAGTVKILGTQLELPYEYKLVKGTESFSSGYGLNTAESQVIEITAGEFQGQTIEIDASYYAPSRVDAGTVQNWMRTEAEKAAGEAGMRSVVPVQVDGFGFNFIDGPSKSKEYPQRMSISGSVNGAIYRLTLFTKDAKLLSAQVAERMKGIRLDYASLLKAKGRFDEEGRLAAKDNWMESPFGRLVVGSGVQSRLSGSYIQRNGAGQTVARRRSFGLYKTGFWTIQNLAISVSCSKEDASADAYADFLHMTKEQNDEDIKDRYTNVSMPQPAVLLGVPAETASATGPEFNALRNVQVNRWAAKKDGTNYMLQVQRVNGSPVENALVKQLANATPACKLDLPFGPSVAAAVPIDIAVPPPAPPAPPAPAAAK